MQAAHTKSMTRTMFHSLIFLGLCTTACGKDSNRSKGNPSAGKDQTAALSPAADSPLLGVWKICLQGVESEDEDEYSGPVPNYKTVQLVRAFDEKGNGYYGTYLFKDEECTDPFTEIDRKKYIAELDEYFKSQGATGLPEEVIAEINKGLADRKTSFSYKLTSSKALSGSIDLADNESGKISYTSYKIEGDILFVADICDQEAVESGDMDCTSVTGDSPSNRATSFSFPLRK